mmetsp:Transcript_15355/g.48376  ORF Transcript_15355/g.48376 Transcript_15355/m.48376 type:complete len:214 (+) Transcript_15355:2650-3291(+)
MRHWRLQGAVSMEHRSRGTRSTSWWTTPSSTPRTCWIARLSLMPSRWWTRERLRRIFPRILLPSRPGQHQGPQRSQRPLAAWLPLLLRCALQRALRPSLLPPRARRRCRCRRRSGQQELSTLCRPAEVAFRWDSGPDEPCLVARSTTHRICSQPSSGRAAWRLVQGAPAAQGPLPPAWYSPWQGSGWRESTVGAAGAEAAALEGAVSAQKRHI